MWFVCTVILFSRIYLKGVRSNVSYVSALRDLMGGILSGSIRGLGAVEINEYFD